jgi:hypothetical protein
LLTCAAHHQVPAAVSRTRHILEPVFSQAIKERRILGVSYVGAVEPQLFGPVRLRVNAERVLVSGYEMSTRRVRWREVDLSTIESARPTEYTLALEKSAPSMCTERWIEIKCSSRDLI